MGGASSALFLSSILALVCPFRGKTCLEGLSTPMCLGAWEAPFQGTSGGVLAAVTHHTCAHVGPALLRSLVSGAVPELSVFLSYCVN